MKEIRKFGDLVGEAITSVRGLHKGSDEIVFSLKDGRKFKLFHSQNCCESVSVEDVCGDESDLLGKPLKMAEESVSDKNPVGVTKDYQGSFTWTFYRLATVKGYVTIRWYGESNGYYSESVDFDEVTR